MEHSQSNAIKLVRGLKLSFGIIAVTIVYAAVITPVLVNIINRKKRHALIEHRPDDRDLPANT
jgi:hypothetical protein